MCGEGNEGESKGHTRRVSGCAARSPAGRGSGLQGGADGCRQKPRQRQRSSRDDAVPLLSGRSFVRRNLR